jgi:hypothetical protein
MESKLRELQELLSKAESELEIYKKERIWAKKVQLMEKIDEKLEKISAESRQMIDIIIYLGEIDKLDEECQRVWRPLCILQNDAAAVRRGVIEYINKTAA